MEARLKATKTSSCATTYNTTNPQLLALVKLVKVRVNVKVRRGHFLGGPIDVFVSDKLFKEVYSFHATQLDIVKIVHRLGRANNCLRAFGRSHGPGASTWVHPTSFKPPLVSSHSAPPGPNLTKMGTWPCPHHVPTSPFRRTDAQ